MLSQTFQPLTTFTDDLLSLIAGFLRPAVIEFSPGQLGSVAALQLELALVPLRIIAPALGAGEPSKIATTDWLKLEEEQAPDNEPMPNIIDMAKARQQRELPQEMPQEVPVVAQEVPADAFTVMGADGRFAVSEYPDGHVVRRWVQLRKGLHFSQHSIPTGGQCDCKQSELGAICCHHKALKNHLQQQQVAEQVNGWKAQERAHRTKCFRYRVIVWRDGSNKTAETFWEGATLDDAEFKLKIASEQIDIETAKIYDRLHDEDLKFYRRWEAQQQVEDARQALGFSPTPKPSGDWQSRQQLEDSIVEAASKLGWSPAQCTAFQKSTLGLPVDSKITRSEMTAEQLQKVADAFTAALKEKQTEKRRQAAMKGRVA